MSVGRLCFDCFDYDINHRVLCCRSAFDGSAPDGANTLSILKSHGQAVSALNSVGQLINMYQRVTLQPSPVSLDTPILSDLFGTRRLQEVDDDPTYPTYAPTSPTVSPTLPTPAAVPSAPTSGPAPAPSSSATLDASVATDFQAAIQNINSTFASAQSGNSSGNEKSQWVYYTVNANFHPNTFHELCYSQNVQGGKSTVASTAITIPEPEISSYYGNSETTFIFHPITCIGCRRDSSGHSCVSAPFSGSGWQCTSRDQEIR